MDSLLAERYKVLGVLGTGGFGRTFVAEDIQRPGTPKCVVKQLEPATKDPNVINAAKRLFETEAVVLERLGKHDQIPQLLAYFEQDGQFYSVEEFIDGHPISDELLPGRQWTESKAIQLLQEVLEVLAFVHSQGVIHQNIKPSNILRRPDGKLVLVDFGAVKRMLMCSDFGKETGITIAVGTPGYMPTEQLQGRPQFSSDIYSLGMVAITAITGLNPGELEDPINGEVCWQNWVQVSPGLANILNKMVRYHCKERYQNASDALQALNYQLYNPQHEDTRRLDAAMPRTCKVGRRTEVRVMIARLNSLGLSAHLPDWTDAGDLISKKDVTQTDFPLEFPIDPVTSKPKPTNVFITITAPEFEIEQASKSLYLSPENESGVGTFFLTPQLRQTRARVIVEVFKDEQKTILLGSLTLITEVRGQQDEITQVVWQLIRLPLQRLPLPSVVIDTVGYKPCQLSSPSPSPPLPYSAPSLPPPCTAPLSVNSRTGSSKVMIGVGIAAAILLPILLFVGGLLLDQNSHAPEPDTHSEPVIPRPSK